MPTLELVKHQTQTLSRDSWPPRASNTHTQHKHSHTPLHLHRESMKGWGRTNINRELRKGRKRGEGRETRIGLLQVHPVIEFFLNHIYSLYIKIYIWFIYTNSLYIKKIKLNQKWKKFIWAVNNLEKRGLVVYEVGNSDKKTICSKSCRNPYFHWISSEGYVQTKNKAANSSCVLFKTS